MDAAIDRTHTGDMYPKSRRTAENLVRRSVKELDDGSVEYVVDMRTYTTASPPVVVEEAQMKEEFFAKVQCKKHKQPHPFACDLGVDSDCL